MFSQQQVNMEVTSLCVTQCEYSVCLGSLHLGRNCNILRSFHLEEINLHKKHHCLKCRSLVSAVISVLVLLSAQVQHSYSLKAGKSVIWIFQHILCQVYTVGQLKMCFSLIFSHFMIQVSHYQGTFQTFLLYRQEFTVEKGLRSLVQSVSNSISYKVQGH